MIPQDRSRRKTTGGRYKRAIKKLRNRGSLPTHTKVGKEKAKIIRCRGGNIKHKILDGEFVNIYSPTEKKYVKAKIETVTGNPANRHYIRRNIITKGAIVKTDKGEVRVTNRPGQEGTINGILIKKSA